MCGITGWIDWEENLLQQEEILDQMILTQINRGPDAAGKWLSSHAALGHRRLIVIDPAGGTQPMVRQRGETTYVLTYNGELYNTPELRRELVTRGHRFQSHSDTEVVLAAYMEWGASCAEHLNGIFAFGVWDTKEQSLFLARDRLGVKPLFYAHQGSRLIFGSELKALLAHPKIPATIDAEGLAEIFILGPSRTPGHGVFCGVSEVRPGHCLRFNRTGLHKWQYWALQSQPHEDDLALTATRVKTLLVDAIERQLVADVPVCTLLSGGLDSSAISAVAANYYQQSGQQPLHTYSIDYLDNDQHFRASAFQPNSDSAWIPRVSAQLGTQHHYITIDTPELVDSLSSAVLARDLPGMADVDSSLYLFCCEIKRDATVALSGECADEIFGGYPWYHNQQDLAGNTFPWLRDIGLRTELLAPEIVDLIRPEEYVERRYLETLDEVPHLPGENEADARMRAMFYLNINWFMANLLDRKDRMSMATGLEVRVPFADHRLVEYVWNIPWSIKYCDNIGKGILRRALQGLLPHDILYRRKSPYPKTHHPAYLAAVRAQLHQVLADPTSPLLPLINRQRIQEMLQGNGSTFERPWFGQLMTDAQLYAFLLQVNTWLERYGVGIRG